MLKLVCIVFFFCGITGNTSTSSLRCIIIIHNYNNLISLECFCSYQVFVFNVKHISFKCSSGVKGCRILIRIYDKLTCQQDIKPGLHTVCVSVWNGKIYCGNACMCLNTALREDI